MVLDKDRENLIQHIFFNIFHKGNNVVLIEEIVT